MERLKYLDQVKGFALIVSVFFILNKLLLIDFKAWQEGIAISNLGVDLNMGIETFSKMALILFTCLAIKVSPPKTLSWFYSRGIKYFILPSVMLILGYEYVGFFWEGIQTLGSYLILGLLLKKLTLKVKYLTLFGLSLIHIALLPYWEELASVNIFTSILFGNFTENNLFNLASALPMFIVSSLIADYLIEDKINFKKTLHTFLLSLFCLSLAISAYKFNHFGGLEFKYPPHILEYLSGLTLGLGLVLLSLKFNFKFFIVLGERSFVLFWISWFLHAILIEWLHFGLYELNLIHTSFITMVYFTIVYFLSLIWEKTYAKK